LSHTFVALAFTVEVSLCDLKFVKWLVRKNRALSMSKNDDEVNEFIDEVTDGAYNLPCVEVISAIGRRENQENSVCTSCRRYQDFHHH
jgi:hypothetical protein